jgi:hypothetical protein
MSFILQDFIKNIFASMTLNSLNGRLRDWINKDFNEETDLYGVTAITPRFCSELAWEDFPGNKLYFDSTPFDLPKNGRWKYRLPYIFDVNKSEISLNQTIVYKNIVSIQIKDGKRGILKDTDHYFIRSNGEIWIKGSQPYLNLVLVVKWNDEQDNQNQTVIKIPPEDMIINATKISQSIGRVRVPYRPCYDGIEVTYSVRDYALVLRRKPGCRFEGLGIPTDDSIYDINTNTFRENILVYQNGTLIDVGGKSLVGFSIYPNTYYVQATLEFTERTVKEYIDQRRLVGLIDCNCYEFTTITEPTVERFRTSNCDCTLTVSENTYVICPDVFNETAYNEYLNGRVTPPTINDLIDPDIISTNPLVLDASYTRLLSSAPCDFGDNTNRIFQKFARKDIRKTSIMGASGFFNGMESMNCFLTSSVQPESSKEFYYDITDCNLCDTSSSYLSVAYGHISGSGSKFTEYEDSDSPTKHIYSQYKLMLLDSVSENFTYYNNGNKNSDSIYVMNMYREYMKDGIDRGNFQLSLSELNGLSYSNSVYTGSNVSVSASNKTITLIDNSGDITQTDMCSRTDMFVNYDIVSGSLTNGIHDSGTGSYSTNPEIKTYGKIYPNAGVIILDAKTLNDELNFNSVTGSNVSGDNSYKLFLSLSGSASVNLPIKMRNLRNKDITHYSVRVAPIECNYTNNPTFVNSLNGRLINNAFVNDPVTYITTVGLYNNSYDLLAIAKLSKPIQKTPEDTVDIKIRLGR